jgi:polyisoprenoid-binding protein YceI
MNRLLMTTAALLALGACSPKTAEAPKPAATPASATPTPGEPVVRGMPDKTEAPAGVYKLDPAHTSLSFKLSHLGFSHFTSRFAKVQATLTFDPANPAGMSVEATIDPKSLDLIAAPAGFHDSLTGKEFLDAGAFPQITFKSTRVDKTGPNTANVTGDLTLHGVTRPIVMAVTFNGGYAPNAYDGARIGFSATTDFKRSDFGVGAGLPAPGTNMGVGDKVSVTIETEFSSGKPTQATPPPPPA